jgi:hypothetical protein
MNLSELSEDLAMEAPSKDAMHNRQLQMEHARLQLQSLRAALLNPKKTRAQQSILGSKSYRYRPELASDPEKSRTRSLVARHLRRTIDANPHCLHIVHHLGGLYPQPNLEPRLLPKFLSSPEKDLAPRIAFLRYEIAKLENGNPAPTPHHYIRLDWPKPSALSQPNNPSEITRELVLPLLNSQPRPHYGLFVPHNLLTSLPHLLEKILPPVPTLHHFWLDFCGNLTHPLVEQIRESLSTSFQGPENPHKLGKVLTTFYDVHRRTDLHRSIVTSNPQWKNTLQAILPLKTPPKILCHYINSTSPMRMAIVNLDIDAPKLPTFQPNKKTLRTLRTSAASSWKGTISRFASLHNISESCAYTTLKSAGWNPKKKTQLLDAACNWSGTIASFARIHSISPYRAGRLLEKAKTLPKTPTLQHLALAE